ncbi:MAG: rhodanese-like domain-containing protein [Treponema sp.]|nr:rhodanese-like domain-containing protein [Treponema sp.]
MFIVLMFSLSACFGSPERNTGIVNPPAHQRITAERAYQMMLELNEFILLDVRTEAEFRERHIAGAILIPIDELEAHAQAELLDKDIVIFVYCRTGVRSENAAVILAGMGYSQVFNMGGIVDWRW